MLTEAYPEHAMSGFPRSQVARLAHIDFRLYFLGGLSRSDLTKRFGTAPGGATRDTRDLFRGRGDVCALAGRVRQRRAQSRRPHRP